MAAEGGGKIMWNEALWLGVPRAEIEEKKIYQGDMNGRFAYYRLDFMLDQRAELKADVYKRQLLCNEAE